MPEKENKDTPYELLHLTEGGCGKPAYYLKRQLKFGDPFHVDDVVNVDGTPTTAGEPVKCGSCNMILSGKDLKTEYIQKRK
ncbi:MAG: hypothetical protein KAS32_13130 [Candidatus Peribacteraceae bacterium]|nr:hypothetical protein [Candidatus Peribacteraceae bacterium]